VRAPPPEPLRPIEAGRLEDRLAAKERPEFIARPAPKEGPVVEPAVRFPPKERAAPVRLELIEPLDGCMDRFPLKEGERPIVRPPL
jgi:hypothetical protein